MVGSTPTGSSGLASWRGSGELYLDVLGVVLDLPLAARFVDLARQSISVVRLGAVRSDGLHSL